MSDNLIDCIQYRNFATLLRVGTLKKSFVWEGFYHGDCFGNRSREKGEQLRFRKAAILTKL